MKRSILSRPFLTNVHVGGLDKNVWLNGVVVGKVVNIAYSSFKGWFFPVSPIPKTFRNNATPYRSLVFFTPLPFHLRSLFTSSFLLPLSLLPFSLVPSIYLTQNLTTTINTQTGKHTHTYTRTHSGSIRSNALCDSNLLFVTNVKRPDFITWAIRST